MTTGCYETSFSLFANARGAGTLLTVKYPALGTHRKTNARGLPGGGGACGWNRAPHTCLKIDVRKAFGD